MAFSLVLPPLFQEPAVPMMVPVSLVSARAEVRAARRRRMGRMRGLNKLHELHELNGEPRFGVRRQSGAAAALWLRPDGPPIAKRCGA